MKLGDFFSGAAKGRKITFDCYTIMRFLTYARILDPGSKLYTWRCLGNYYEKPGFDYHHILRYMDILYENFKPYLRWIYEKEERLFGLDVQGTYITTENLIKTLQNLNVVNVHDIEYVAIYKRNRTLDALTELSGLELDRMHYHPKDLNKKFL